MSKKNAPTADDYKRAVKMAEQFRMERDAKGEINLKLRARIDELEDVGGAKLAKMEKIISDQESAFRGQEATIRQLRAEAERDARLIADKINVINANERRINELGVDLRVTDQELTIAKAKYDALVHAIGVITGKETF